jgi:hypothetical protein
MLDIKEILLLTFFSIFLVFYDIILKRFNIISSKINKNKEKAKNSYNPPNSKIF